MIEQIILLIILILINAFFAATEIAFISLNDYKIKKEAKKGDKKSIAILSLLQKPSSFLATIQIGITLAGFLSSAFASSAFAEKLAPLLYDIIPQISLDTWNTISIVVITIILSFFMLLFGELVPKRVAMKHDKKIAFFSVNIIKTIAIITKPFVYMLTSITNSISKIFGVSEYEEEHITEEEIRLIIDQGEERGAIKKYEQRLLKNVLKFNNIKVNDIIVEKDKIFTLSVDLTIEDALNGMKNSGYKHSRIPLVNKNNEVEGILHIKDLVKNITTPKILLKDIMHEVIRISKEDYAIAAYNKMKRNKKHILIVEENDDFIGVITLEDVLEIIFGDIKDEYGL